MKETDSFVAEIDNFIFTHELLRNIKSLGIAVSGGADSVALFHVLYRLLENRNIKLYVLHFNHRLRGKNADLDEKFVQKLAQQNEIEFYAGRAETTFPSDSTDEKIGLSLEMWARQARHDFFRQAVVELKLDAIATAHHADDRAETLLLRLARGAGMTGLSGLKPSTIFDIAPQKKYKIIRPLLDRTRDELEYWLNHNKFLWREDESNSDTTIPRNYLRTTIIPLLEKKWHPNLRNQLTQSSEILRCEDELLDQLAKQELLNCLSAKGDLKRSALKRLPLALQRRVMRLWLFSKGYTGDKAGFTQINLYLERFFAGKPIFNIESCNKGKTPLRQAILRLPETGTVIFDNRYIITITKDKGIIRKTGDIGKFPVGCSLNCTLTQKEIFVRYRKAGDRIAPTGMAGSRKLKDIFIDAKIPLCKRDKIPVLVCGDEIVWLPGYRVARAFAIQDLNAENFKIEIEQICKRRNN